VPAAGTKPLHHLPCNEAGIPLSLRGPERKIDASPEFPKAERPLDAFEANQEVRHLGKAVGLADGAQVRYDHFLINDRPVDGQFECLEITP